MEHRRFVFLWSCLWFSFTTALTRGIFTLVPIRLFKEAAPVTFPVVQDHDCQGPRVTGKPSVEDLLLLQLHISSALVLVLLYEHDQKSEGWSFLLILLNILAISDGYGDLHDPGLTEVYSHSFVRLALVHVGLM